MSANRASESRDALPLAMEEDDLFISKIALVAGARGIRARDLDRGARASRMPDGRCARLIAFIIGRGMNDVLKAILSFLFRFSEDPVVVIEQDANVRQISSIRFLK